MEFCLIGSVGGLVVLCLAPEENTEVGNPVAASSRCFRLERSSDASVVTERSLDSGCSLDSGYIEAAVCVMLVTPRLSTRRSDMRMACHASRAAKAYPAFFFTKGTMKCWSSTASVFISRPLGCSGSPLKPIGVVQSYRAVSLNFSAGFFSCAFRVQSSEGFLEGTSGAGDGI